ncbi:MAG TPA: hypothetical protein VMY88_08915 [Acidimicrobiales bacterium]|nr:hypothetical protein [Acidimicrobiales bacterium]
MSEHLVSDVIAVPAAPDPDDLMAGGRESSSRLRLVFAIGAVIAVAAGIFLVTRLDGGTTGSASVINGGDLGAQSDAIALSERLGPVLAERKSPGASVAPGSVPCDDSEAALPQDQADLVYSARLDWEGTPAVVLGYRVEGPSLARLLLVMAESDCRLIVTQSF